MKNSYTFAKNLFIDSTDSTDFIELEPSVLAYNKLVEILDKPYKIIVLYGKSGTGKSILLSRLENKLKHKKEIYYFDTPVTDEKIFYKRILKILTNSEFYADSEINFSMIMEYCKDLKGKREITLLLDEAHIYGVDLMEKIRLLTDTRIFKCIITLPKTKVTSMMTEAHFKTRVWESIGLTNNTLEYLANYIYKKLLTKNLFEIADSLKDKEIQLIYEFTKGNYRECNKLLFTIFEICEYYDNHEPDKILHEHISQKIVEMAGLKLGYINA